MVLQQQATLRAERRGDGIAFIGIEHDAVELIEQRDVIMEDGAGLGDGLQRHPGAAQRDARLAMSVDDAGHIRPRSIDARVDKEGRVHGAAAAGGLPAVHYT